MKSNEIVVYQQKNASWVTSYPDRLNDLRVRNFFNSESDAKAFKKEVLKGLRSNSLNTFSHMSIADLMRRYLEEAEDHRYSMKRVHLQDFVNTFNDRKVIDLTTEDMKVFLERIQKETKLSESTMRGIKCRVDHFFKYLIKKEVITESPLKEVFYRNPVPDLKSRNILSSGQMLELLSEVKRLSPGYLYPIIKLVHETLLKTNELFILSSKSLKPDHKILLKGTGSSQERTLAITPELYQTLKNKADSDLLFKTYYGEGFTKNKLTRAIKEFKTKSKTKFPWNLMDIRHSRAVELIESGKSFEELKYILGHKSLFDTKRMYGDAVKKDLESKTIPLN